MYIETITNIFCRLILRFPVLATAAGTFRFLVLLFLLSTSTGAMVFEQSNLFALVAAIAIVVAVVVVVLCHEFFKIQIFQKKLFQLLIQLGDFWILVVLLVVAEGT